MRRVILGTAGVIIALFIIYFAWFFYPASVAELGQAAPTATLDPDLLLEGVPVPRPDASPSNREHGFFPLVGGHEPLSCAACHQEGVYSGLDPACQSCHLEEDPHDGRNGPNCGTCHSVDDWANAIFDHSLIGDTDCGECHAPPPDHFPGACATCHLDTTSFASVSFDHATIGTTDCAACHTPPPNHFPGACSTCHIDTSSFINVNFDHAVIGATDCVACHAPPANHYPGTCSTCHIDTSNFLNVNFDHSVIGATDCVACHAPPPNHFPGRCRDCHTDTSNFSNAAFNHTFPLNHGEANSNCATCHTGGNYSQYTCFNCHNQAEMVEEHADKGIFDITNCVACHADGQKPDD